MKIAVVGLGYVGLPLAVALARKHQVLGFDVSTGRIAELRSGVDSTNEIDGERLKAADVAFTANAGELAGSEVFVVTVPTPIDQANRPDLSAMLNACALIGPAMSKGSIVVFESTVYPGVTEEVCGPALEEASGLRSGIDFKLGYSPERINPGDREHPIEKIVKVVAGQDEDTLETLADLYGSVVEAGIHRASSIKVAEAAKVIENTQRDLNIALMNEVSKICDLLGIRSSEVLAAAGTKWNFLKFHPGLVGGHCIGVDPYYLTAKAEQLGYHPEVILSGRRINDGMARYVAQRTVKLLAARARRTLDARVGVLGLTFKQNVPDTRNSKVADLLAELQALGVQPLVHDPFVPPSVTAEKYGAQPTNLDDLRDLDALVLAVPHDAYLALISTFGDRIVAGGMMIDIPARVDPRSLREDIGYWSL